MKTKLILLFTINLMIWFFPMVVMAQDNSNWITPVANIEFKDNLVVYTCQVCDPEYRLKPLFITDKFMVISSPQTGYSSTEEIPRIKEWLTGQVNSFPVESSADVKELYLKECALYIIWGIGGGWLPDENLEQHIAQFEQDLNSEISHQATLVRQLYESVMEGMNELKMMKR